MFCAAGQLPDADKLFNAVKKPSFLGSKSCDTDIDWDKLAKTKMPSDSDVRTNTHTVPPPVCYEPQSAALKPTLGDPHEAVVNERKRHVQDTDVDSSGLYMISFFIDRLYCLHIYLCDAG